MVKNYYKVLNFSINSMQHGVHSGSNGTISSIEAVAAGTSSPPQSMNMESVVSSHVPASMSTSVNRVRKTVQETLDYDGLVKYQDDEQEVYRRYKENCNVSFWCPVRQEFVIFARLREKSG